MQQEKDDKHRNDAHPFRRGTASVLLAATAAAAFFALTFFIFAGRALAQEPYSAKLSINIPTIRFSTVQTSGSSGYIDIPWIGEYMRGLYSYALGIAGLLAGVMVVIGGFQYLTAGGDMNKVKAGKQRIADAFIGLFLVFGAYLILNTVSPELTSLPSLHIQQVARITFRTTDGVLNALGSMGSEEAYSSLPDVGTVTPGQYRQQMLAACGGRDGMSLSPTDRVARLRTIVSTWKTIGADQGGAIYIRGGNPDCGRSNPQTSFVLGSMITIKRAGVALGISDTCDHVVDQAMEAHGGAEVAAIASSNGSCREDWVGAYNRLVMAPAHTAGLFCGDCFTTQISLYNCFDRSFGWTYFGSKRLYQSCPTPGPNYVFVLGPDPSTMTDAAIDEAVTHLQFGDVVTWQQITGLKTGHVFLYTGGAGLGYEMLEMGAGGSGDVSSSGGARASRNAGYAWRSSGMQAHDSARAFIAASRGFVTRGGNRGCVYAFRPLARE